MTDFLKELDKSYPNSSLKKSQVSSKLPSSTHKLTEIIKLIRPHQWTKNLFCLAGLLFGERLLELSAIASSLLTVVLFSFIASAIYIFNDIQDRKRDRQHPKKQFRPLAKGTISISLAISIALFLSVISLSVSYHLGYPTFACLLLYAINNIAYSLKLKNIPLLDVSCIAFGFVLRLLAGIYALGDIPTAWIVLCTFFLTLFLGFAKRRAELLALLSNPINSEFLEEQETLLESKSDPSTELFYLQLFYQRGQPNSQRPVLSQYTLPFLDSLLNSTATMTIMCYSLFTITSGKNSSLIITVPIVYYAVMHYKRIVTVLATGEEPDQLLLQDHSLKFSIVIWLILYLLILYFDIHLFD